MITRLLRLPYGTAQNIGFGLLFAILVAVVIIAYSNSHQGNQALHVLIDVHTPRLKQLQQIHAHLLTAHAGFNTSIQTRPPSFQEILSAIDDLEHHTRELEQYLATTGLPIPATRPVQTLLKTRTTLLQQTAAQNVIRLDPFDSNQPILTRLEENLAAFKECLFGIVPEHPPQEFSEPIQRLLNNCHERLSELEWEVKRQLTRPRTAMETAIKEVEEAQILFESLRQLAEDDPATFDPERMQWLAAKITRFRTEMQRHHQEVIRSNFKAESLDKAQKNITRTWHAMEEAIMEMRQRLIGQVKEIETNSLAV
ncbi:MAG: hypothetical protein HQL95_03320, partial [Magnetococcales bacterium]|nr:hypothetical protein [Magnetococcales bacterium]